MNQIKKSISLVLILAFLFSMVFTFSQGNPSYSASTVSVPQFYNGLTITEYEDYFLVKTDRATLPGSFNRLPQYLIAIYGTEDISESNISDIINNNINEAVIFDEINGEKGSNNYKYNIIVLYAPRKDGGHVPLGYYINEAQSKEPKGSYEILHDYNIHGSTITSALWDGNKFVIYDRHGYRTAYATDGMNWVFRDILGGFFDGELIWNKSRYLLTGRLLLHGDGGFVHEKPYQGSGVNNFELTYLEKVRTFELPVGLSSDGINFEIVSGKADDKDIIEIYDNYVCALWDGNKYILIFDDKNIENNSFALTSNDGRLFEKKEISINYNNVITQDCSIYFKNVIHNGKTYFASALAVKEEDAKAYAVLKSNDGLNWDVCWTELTDVIDAEQRIIYGNNKYYMAISKRLYSSNDGVKWAEAKSNLVNNIYGAYDTDPDSEFGYPVNTLFENGIYFVQIDKKEAKADNRIYISADLNDYYYIDFDTDIGKILCIHDDIIVTENKVIALSVYKKYAMDLSKIDVFRGTEYGFELLRKPTRIEGIIMQIRMLGKEDEATALKDEPCIFKDVPAWARGYVNYAYRNGLTKGLGNGLFGTNVAIDGKSYMTLMLRAIGYNDSNGDFKWDSSLEKAKDIGLLNAELFSVLNEGAFNRDYIAKITYNTLLETVKNSNISLAQKLVNEGLINKDKAIDIGLLKPN